MNPEKSLEQQLKNQIDILSQEVAEYKAKLAAIEAKKQKKQKITKYVARAKFLAAKIGRYLCRIPIALSAIGAIYCLIWLFEPLKKVTYQGSIVAISSKERKTQVANRCKLYRKDGKLKSENCNINPTATSVAEYTINIAFLGEDDKQITRSFSTEGTGWVLPWNYAKLPFPEYYKRSQLYVGNAVPHIGCEVGVYDLRGKWLNGASVAHLVANASMCKGALPAPAPPAKAAKNAETAEKIKPVSRPEKK